MEPKENLFYFGKVINANVESKNPLFNGGYLVYLYNYPAKTKEIPNQLDTNRLKGYFETVGSRDVTCEEKNLDYGFWHSTFEKFYSLPWEEILKEKPSQFIRNGLISYGGVGRGIHRLLSGQPHNL
ncbi:Imm26 family immunity protein [Paenibacillus chitinolyticus]|uniref:Imm26 family immunity protein n=1 Tax=Paenibacillus chitinolyticus TaxID=79263 RepID=UPI003558B91E